jgi:hypothetical protein
MSTKMNKRHKTTLTPPKDRRGAAEQLVFIFI